MGKYVAILVGEIVLVVAVLLLFWHLGLMQPVIPL